MIYNKKLTYICNNYTYMQTKLTLSIDKSVIEKAKLYAKNTGKSLSEIIQHFLESLTEEHIVEEPSIKLKKLHGSVKLPKNFDEKKELREYLKKKHL